MYDKSFYLDTRYGSYAGEPKVVLFSFDAEAGNTYTFTLDVPATGDFDIIIYDDDYSASTGRPIVAASSINSGSGVDEYVSFIAPETATFYWSIRAVSGYGTCDMTTTGLTAATAPSAPQNLQAIAGIGNVTLTWQVPVSDGGTAITNYKIYRGTSSGSETLLTTVGTVLTYVDTNVTVGHTYYYKVAAVNAIGESVQSNEASATVTEGSTGPGVPGFEPLTMIATLAGITGLVFVYYRKRRR
ncbi:MAG: putative protease [Promethearchaeota archaeon CR_4]|nr:MAG: putative protease [Candidatus Lokiarchaeota archaeon CR_4]